jgi:hypothetical protein
MVTVARHIDAPPERVFAILEDGWSYPLWVVGTSTVHAVDHHWPQPGARIHPVVGLWPFSVPGRTESLMYLPGRGSSLRIRIWAFGEARIDITVEAEKRGSQVTIHERLTTGPLRWLSRLADVPLHVRNRELLQRLAKLAEAGGRTNTPHLTRRTAAADSGARVGHDAYRAVRQNSQKALS